ncbi:MAG: thioredoxin family protein [bacterium]|nr:thioredoxin family protein [bacterium]
MKIRFILPLCALLLFSACSHEDLSDTDSEERVEVLIEELMKDLAENPLEIDHENEETMKEVEAEKFEKDPVAAEEPVVIIPTVASVGTYTSYYNGVIGNGEPAVLFFHAAWCPYCQKNDALLNNFYDTGDFPLSTYKIDYDTASELKSRFGVVQQDTFVVIDGAGNKVSSKSFPSEDALRAMIEG